MNLAYNTVVHWKHNPFRVPFGNVGKQFVSELARLYKAFATSSSMESIALQAVIVMPILLLQKPGNTSTKKGTNNNNFTLCLKCRLQSWLDGNLTDLIAEGKTLQHYCSRASRSNNLNNNLAHSFSNFMLNGKVSSTIRLLSEQLNSGLLHLDDAIENKSVIDILFDKHPPPQHPHPSSLLSDNPLDCHPVLFEAIDASLIRSTSLRTTTTTAGPSGLDALYWRRLCTSFKSASLDLCNSLNHCTALHNFHRLCPPLATVLTKTYRHPTSMSVDGCELQSAEGTTQGDPLAMPMYAIATTPLIQLLQDKVNGVSQVWYSDDACASGNIRQLHAWWEFLASEGPKFGYFPTHPNCGLSSSLLTYPPLLLSLPTQGLNYITSNGRPYLGSAIGTNEFVTSFAKNKIAEWTTELETLTSIAHSHPHAAYSAFIHGLSNKWHPLCVPLRMWQTCFNLSKISYDTSLSLHLLANHHLTTSSVTCWPSWQDLGASPFVIRQRQPILRSNSLVKSANHYRILSITKPPSPYMIYTMMSQKPNQLSKQLDAVTLLKPPTP